MTPTSLIRLALLGAVLIAPARAQTFVDLPIGSWANDVTPDGEIVVGTWPGGGFIWRWRVDPTPTLIPDGDVVGVSNDGSVVCGNWNDPVLGMPVAAIWTQAGGWQSLGQLPGGPCGSSYATAYDISGDGTTVVGLGWDGCSAVGFRWTAATGMVALQNLVNGTNRASTISGDGSAIGGFAQGSFTRTPAYWEADTSGSVIDPDYYGEVFGFDEAGTRSVGTLLIEPAQQYDAYWRDEASGQITNLGSLNGGNWSGQATDISEDGRVIVGFDVLGLGREAWVWTDVDGMISMNDRLAALGVTGVDDLFVCRAVSDDGTVVVGGGVDGGGGPFGFGGFIATLPSLTWQDLGNGLAGSGGVIPVLEGVGDLTGGSPTSIELSAAHPNSSAWLVVGFTQIDAPFKFGVMVPNPDLILGPLPTSPTGTLTLNSAWPVGAPSGFESFWQEWVQDPGGPVGFSATNGLKGITP